jgi:hypothetical protein
LLNKEDPTDEEIDAVVDDFFERADPEGYRLLKRIPTKPAEASSETAVPEAREPVASPGPGRVARSLGVIDLTDLMRWEPPSQAAAG